MPKPVVLIAIGAFWPGSESSGPNQSIRGLCEALSHLVDFRIIARDRPFGGTFALTDSTHWHDLGFGQVHYLTVGRAGARGLAQLLRATPHDILHLNGFFDREFTIPALVARWLRHVPRRPVLLSPRGEFSSGALRLQANAKRAYLTFARVTGLLAGVRLHTTSGPEDADVAAALPEVPRIRAENVRSLPPRPPHVPRAPGAPFRIAFVGRISTVKGVHTALQALAGVSSPIDFDIYGPISDPAYWGECQRLIAALPSHIRVVACGEVSNTGIVSQLGRYDALLLPSRSENFGHAIFEALAAGTPVLIGDGTPWRHLAAAHAGFDVALDRPALLTQAIERIATMPDSWRDSARELVERYVASSNAVDRAHKMYGNLLALDLDH